MMLCEELESDYNNFLHQTSDYLEAKDLTKSCHFIKRKVSLQFLMLYVTVNMLLTKEAEKKKQEKK